MKLFIKEIFLSEET